MGEKIVIGPINRGLRTDRTAFVIDNDSFPTLINAYQWRGRVKRKRGTSPLGRLERFLGTTNGSGNLTVVITPTPIATGITTFIVGTDIFVDPGTTADPGTQTLLTNSAGSGTLNRVSGTLTITGSQLNTAVLYFPTLPVMGLEDFVMSSNAFPGTLGFDTIYSYNLSTLFPYNIYDVSFYKNPPASASLPGYVPKGTWTRTSWNGRDYQQFWTVNYQGALWATNGIDVPFTGSTIGMQFKKITAINFIVPGPPATALITIANHGLVVGDFVFVNEVPPTAVTGINFQTGYVVNVLSANTFTIEFPNATLGGPGGNTSGIVQYLTSQANPAVDSLRWYDGDPTNGNPTNPTFIQGNGWVNFSPPLSQASFSIADLPPAQYYLVGARMIQPFKDRLLFLGPVIQSSSSTPMYLQDTVIFSQNGTPYYTASYTNTPNAAVDNPTSPTNVFNPILVPNNQTATPSAYFEDQTGFGGFITAGIDQELLTSAFNEDVIIAGFRRQQTRLAYTGNDLLPFNFFSINTEFGASSTFSVVTLDQGVITRGSRGYTITSQVDCQRIDLEIPDMVFEVNEQNNGTERFCSLRDFINEWIYFTYPSNQVAYKFPNQTLLFNYRDNSWSVFNECYTTYGLFRKQSGETWATLPADLTWASWTDPWNSGSLTLFQPDVIAGNQQGFVVFRDDDIVEETNSLAIQNIVGSVITSPNHCLNNNDYITISGALGTVAASVNGKIFSVQNATTNTFNLNPGIASATYLGGGVIKRMYVPDIQTKQFPVAWEMARKTRLGPQQYLLTTTDDAQITLLIFLSQNSASAYNTGAIVPDPASTNNSLLYSTILFTCPESINIGLTPANTNLQMPTASSQSQTWHRVNTSLIGDTVQLGFTLSDTQMRAVDMNGNPISQFAEIELHSIVLDVQPSQVLA